MPPAYKLTGLVSFRIIQSECSKKAQFKGRIKIHFEGRIEERYTEYLVIVLAFIIFKVWRKART